VADMTPGGTGVLEAILSGPQASMGLFVEPDRETVERAESLAEDFGLKDRLKRPFALLSSGERQRTLLARAALAEPELLILDEPMSGLDVGGRELFLNLTARLASGPGAPTIVMTTHNVQEIGAFMTHALLLKDGGASAAGPLAETLTEERLGELFDLPLRIERNAAGRWLAWLD
jgi:iron complex transport system ATP-binding protein